MGASTINTPSFFKKTLRRVRSLPGYVISQVVDLFPIFCCIHHFPPQLLYTGVLDPLHPLLTIALELPEDYFCNIHQYKAKSEDHLWYMKYTKYMVTI